MKIHNISFGTIVLLTSANTNAFIPRKTDKSISIAQQPAIRTSPTITKTALFTATLSNAEKVKADLDLIYTPIAPFGKTAENSNLGGDAKRVLGGKGA